MMQVWIVCTISCAATPAVTPPVQVVELPSRWSVAIVTLAGIDSVGGRSIGDAGGPSDDFIALHVLLREPRGEGALARVARGHRAAGAVVALVGLRARADDSASARFEYREALAWQRLRDASVMEYWGCLGHPVPLGELLDRVESGELGDKFCAGRAADESCGPSVERARTIGVAFDHDTLAFRFAR